MPCGAPGEHEADRQRLASDLDAVSLHEAEIRMRAFSLHFEVTNLAEEKQRIRERNPQVTAQSTCEAVAIQSDHVLRAYENVCRRLASTITARLPPGAAVARRLAFDARDLPAPHRQWRGSRPAEHGLRLRAAPTDRADFHEISTPAVDLWTVSGHASQIRG